MKPSRKFIIIVVVLMAFSLLLGACTPAPTETPEAAGRAEAEEPAAEATDAPAVAVDEPDLDEAPTADASATAESEAATATAEAEATATAEATEAAPATPEEVPGDIEGFDAAVQAFFDGAKNFNSITPQQLNELIESGNSPHIVDVRTEEDMEASGHFIPGAVNVPLRLLALNVHWLPLDREAP
ncbi:MAG: rhodanese-like domain-containing protein, partial [Chloroflexi bacterium]|nr:rhodanese-like domain-containing protein [Chloroflexota bacterium]